MKVLQMLVLAYLLFLFPSSSAQGVDKKPAGEISRSIIYLQPNTTQLFTELYQAFGLLNPAARTFFEEALYLDQPSQGGTPPLQDSNQIIFDHASQVLTEFHKRVNDLELYIDPSKPKPFFYTASGSKHLIVALVYAIVMSEPNKKFLFVEQAPFYSGHPNAVSGIFNYPNARFFSFHETSEIKLEADEELVEIVTSPNNPDGKFRKPLTKAQIIIADFVFASSVFGMDGTGYREKNIEWVKNARVAGKHVFSFNSASKQFGKTGARCGYIWYPLYDAYAASIFKKFFYFISCSTVAGGTTGLAEFLNLIKAFLDLSDNGEELRREGHKSLVRRHELVAKEVVNRYPGSIVISLPGSPTFFAKIKENRLPKAKASDVIFEDLGVVVNQGEPMGETNEYIRLNLSGYSQILVEFLNRLANKKKYSVQDVLLVTRHECSHFTVYSKEDLTTLYIAKPGDCSINAEASIGPIEIILPPFIDYDKVEIMIKKIDSSTHSVVIKTENFTKTLHKLNEYTKVQWNQPLYLSGRWVLVSPDK